MAKKETVKEAPKTVSLEDYNKLLGQAQELEKAYNQLKAKLVAISNVLSL